MFKGSTKDPPHQATHNKNRNALNPRLKDAMPMFDQGIVSLVKQRL